MKNSELVKNLDPDHTVDLDRQVIDFYSNGLVKVATYSLLTKDFPGAQWVERLGKYRAWSRTQWVGDYDDWQIRETVEETAKSLGVLVTGWYERDD